MMVRAIAGKESLSPFASDRRERAPKNFALAAGGELGAGLLSERFVRTGTMAGLVLSLAYLALGIWYNLLPAGAGLTNRMGNAVGTDFIAFYGAARLTLQGMPEAAYDLTRYSALLAQIIGTGAARYSWSYPPLILLIIAPLGALPYLAALALWTGAGLGLLIAALYRLARDWSLALAGLAHPGVVQSLIAGQNGIWSAGGFGLGLALLGSAPWLAGIAFGMMAYKPQLLILVPIALAAGGHWRALLSMGTTIGLFALLSIAAFGLDPWAAFLNQGMHHMGFVTGHELPWQRMPTVFIAVLQATGRPVLAAIAQSVAAAAAAAACWAIWRRGPIDLAAIAALTAGTALATPYAFDYDLALLALPSVVALAGERSFLERWDNVLLLMLVWTSPLVCQFGSKAAGLQIGPLLTAAILVLACRAARSDRIISRPA